MVWRYREGEWVWNKSVFFPSFTFYLSLSSYTFLRLFSSYTFLLFSSQYLNFSSSFTSLFVFALCAVQRAVKHSDVWYITLFIIRAQSLIPAFNLFITKLTDPCLKQAAIWSVHQHAHFTPTITNPLKKTTTETCQEHRGIIAMFGVRSWREGHFRLSELYMREWLRPLMDAWLW